MNMRDVIDPYKGVPYSQILENLPSDKRKAYHENEHPMIKVPGTGQAGWMPWCGRWVV